MVFSLVLHILVLGFGLFFGQHDDLIDKISDPFFRKAQTFVVGAYGHDGFHHASILVVVAVEDVRHRFLGHGVDGFFHERRHTELEFHEVAHQHHKVLGEALELDKVRLHILHLAAVFLDALVNFSEKVVLSLVQVLKHLSTMLFLARTQLVVQRRHTQSGFEQAKVWQHGQIGDTDILGNGCLKIDAHKRHIVFHTAGLGAVILFLSKNSTDKSHFFLLYFTIYDDQILGLLINRMQNYCKYGKFQNKI